MKNGPYDDIINMPHHVSATHPQMSVINRAAQFSPFAALTGYDAAIAETGRLTNERIELGENAIDDLDLKLNILTENVHDHPEISVTYFQPDERKTGGEYVTANGAVKKVDEYERAIVLLNGEKIAIADVLDIGCELFKDLI